MTDAQFAARKCCTGYIVGDVKIWHQIIGHVTCLLYNWKIIDNNFKKSLSDTCRLFNFKNVCNKYSTF